MKLQCDYCGTIGDDNEEMIEHWLECAYNNHTFKHLKEVER
jgi:hypothetical protein